MRRIWLWFLFFIAVGGFFTAVFAGTLVSFDILFNETTIWAKISLASYVLAMLLSFFLATRSVVSPAIGYED